MHPADRIHDTGFLRAKEYGDVAEDLTVSCANPSGAGWRTISNYWLNSKAVAAGVDTAMPVPDD